MIRQLKIPAQLHDKLQLPPEIQSIKLRVDSRDSSNKIQAIIPMALEQVGPKTLSVKFKARLAIDLADDSNNDLLTDTGADNDTWIDVITDLYDADHDNLDFLGPDSISDYDEWPNDYDPDSADFTDANIDRADDDQLWFNDGYSTVDIPVDVQISFADGTVSVVAVEFFAHAEPVSISGNVDADDTTVSNVDVSVNPFDDEVLDQAAVTPVTIDPPYRTEHVDSFEDAARFTVVPQDIDVKHFDATAINKTIARNADAFAKQLVTVDVKAN